MARCWRRPVQQELSTGSNVGRADALATAVFVLGPVEGMALVRKLDGVKGLILDHEGVVTLSPGLQ